MTLQDLGNLGEFVGSIGVVATLIYLAVQIRQNTTSLRINGLLASRELSHSVASLLTQPGMTEIYLEGMENYPDLLPEKAVKFELIMVHMFNPYETNFLQRRAGVLTESESFEWSGMIHHLKQPGVRIWWDRMSAATFAVAFREHVNSLLEKQDAEAPQDDA